MNEEFMEASEEGLEPKPDIVRIDLDPAELTFAEYNPNEMTAQQLQLLIETIQEVGFIDPVTVVKLDSGKYEIVGGEHRARAAKAIGLKTIPVDVLQGDKWQDEDRRKFQNTRLNVIHGKMNPEKFVKLYNEMAAKYGSEKVTRMMGYTSDAGIRKIVQSVSKQMKETLPPELATKFEEKAREARTVGDLSNIIQQLFQEYGDSMKFNFMIFSWGGKEHYYIAISKKVHMAMKRIMDASREGSLDINDIIGGSLEALADSLDREAD